jgi:hypothetical protein
MKFVDKIKHKYHFMGTAYDVNAGTCALHSIKNSYKKLTGDNLSLRKLAKLSQDNGYIDYETMTTKPEFAKFAAENLNLDIKVAENSHQWIESVKSGLPVIIQSTGGRDVFNIGSHAMTITGYTDDGFIEITDSAFNKSRFKGDAFKQGVAYIKNNKIYMKPELVDKNIKQAFMVNMKDTNSFD